MKKLIARILLACMLLSVLAVLPALPSMAEETKLKTDKAVYTVGEPILVTAEGENADWVGLYCVGDAYDPDQGGVTSIYWYYVAKDGTASGDTKNIYEANYNNFANRPEFASGIPAGQYQIVLMENDGYTVLERVDITIVDGDTPDTPDTPSEWAPTEDRPLVTDKTEYIEGEDILVKALGSGTDWVGLYVAGETPPTGSPPSIYWFYVEENDHAAGDVRNLKNETFNSDRSAYKDIPAGEYRLVLCPNDGYHVQYEVAITVKEDPADKPEVTKPDAPKSAAYQSADAGTGRADGTLTITRGTNSVESYVIRWANADGALAAYTEVATIPCAGETTTYTMTPHTLVPAGADRLLVYAKNGDRISDKPATAQLPDGAGEYDLGKVLGELQVMSDIHINPSDAHIHNKHFAAALADIQKNSPNSMGIFVNGDVADHGQRSEYDALNRLIKAAGAGTPPVYCAIGNHDLGGGQSAEAQIAQFLKGTNNDSETVYFEREIGGYRFIFLGGEVVSLHASLSRDQLNWLDETLDKSADEGKPVFLFLHQGVMDMVAGTFQYQGWHGVEQAAQLKKILKDHPEVIMFAGHSHWTLESKQSIKPADHKFPTVLNTSSCAYLWDDEANKTNQGIEGSQGYYITIYEDFIAFRGRDFANGLWTSSAQFVIPWTLNAAEDPGESETGAETSTEESSADTATETNDDLSVDTSVDTSADTAIDTSADTIAESGSETKAPDEGGCGSVIGAGALVVLLSVGVIFRRRKSE